MWQFVAISVLTAFLVWLWMVFNFFWLEPKKIEKILRKQGFEGNPYRAPFGDSKEIAAMYADVHSKPIGLYDNVVPRVMPYVLKTINQYGKNSFAWIGPRPRIYVTDPHTVREVLTRHTSFQKNFRVTNYIYKLLVGGIVEFEEEKWARHRAKMNPGFHMERLKPMCLLFVSHCEEIFNEWKTKLTNGSGVVDVFPYTRIYASTSVSRALYSHPFDADMQKCFYSLLELAYMANIAVKTFDIPGKKLLPTFTQRKAVKLERELRAIFKTKVVERIKKRRAGEGNGKSDLIDLCVDELYDEKKAKDLDEEGMIDDAVGNLKLFSFAGFETTSNMLVWAMINLAIYPEWQTRAREEVKRVLGGRKRLEPDDISKLKVVNMVVHEVLRMFPPIFELSRIVDADTQVGNYLFPKGVLIQVPVAIVHRDKDVWGPDADVFNPSRFSEGVLKAAKGQVAFLPFGWGPRICLGMNFALMETKIFLATAVNTFIWELSQEYIHAPYAAFSLQPQHNAPLTMHEI